MDNFIIVSARIAMKRTADGGRSSGIFPGYRPNHVFELPAKGHLLNAWPGEIQFDHQQSILPGETTTVTVRFVNVPGLENYITVGRKWSINEGPNTVGEAEILEVLSNTAQ